MIAEIARYLSAIEIDGDFKRTSASTACVIEAGTGTGKTLAYLLATLPFAKVLRKNIVIATATVTLQQQIMERELPLLKNYTDLQFNVALAKGRRRYLCLHKVDMNLHGDAQGGLDFAGLNPAKNNEPETKAADTVFSPAMYQQFIDWMVDHGWPGDFESLPEPVNQALWDQVSTDHRQCLNKGCGFFSQCPYFRNKADIDQAELVVANHDLVFADLNLGGGFVLPPPEQTIYIFDEGHHLSTKALNHFAYSAGIKSAQKLLKALSKLIADGQTSWASDEKIATKVMPLSTVSVECHNLLDAIQIYLWENTEWQSEAERESFWFRYPMGILPDALQAMAAQCASLLSEFVHELEDIVSRVRELTDKERQGALSRQQLEQVLLQLTSYQSQSENLMAVWQQMQNRSDKASDIPVARWLSTFGADKDSEITVHVSPTNIAGLLQQRLWNRAFAVIMTSATMSIAGNFARLIGQTGIPENSVYSIHQSPFDFAANCTLQLVDPGAEPSDRDSYLNPLATSILQLVNPQEATLVLFSSKRHMNAIADRVGGHYADGLLKVQERESKARLLADHRKHIDQQRGSVIFGLAGFAEGLDLPGRYLVHVIVAKLPFSVPDDPVEATYGEWLRKQGGNPFHQVVIPDATTRLLQACGRLLRSERDVGKISICDRRLWTKSYGATIMQALPPYRRQWLKPDGLATGCD